MSTRTAGSCIVLGIFCLLQPFSSAQQSPSIAPSAIASGAITPNTRAMEFPVFLQSSVVAGKAQIGAKVQAKLQVATLVEGKVIPRNAVFTGEVIESVAKSATSPSRLGIRIDSVQWKDGSAAVKAYLTAWYYPVTAAAGQNLRYGPEQTAKQTWNGMGQYPDAHSPNYRPFPSSTSDQNTSPSDTAAPVPSNHRVWMPDMESESSGDGTTALISRKNNIKLDKVTMYVLATGDLQPPPLKPAGSK